MIWLIRLYQKTFSLDHGPLRHLFPDGYCRYHPTCSQYAIDAITKYGHVKGTILACKRILRCHPWAPFGHDPVP